MQTARLRLLRRLVQSEPELALLSERLASSALAGSSASSAAAIGALARHEAALTRLAPRLFGTLVGCGRSGGLLPRGGAAAGVVRRELQQAEASLWRRLFSSEAPRRGWEKFYPKGKGRRPGQAKGGKEAEASKRPMEGAATGGSGGPGDSFEMLTKKGLQQLLPIVLVMLAAATLMGAGRQDAQEVSFQWFKTQLLAKGVVEKLEVANKQTVKVYVRPVAAGRRTVGAGAAADAASDDFNAGDGDDLGGAPGVGAGTPGGASSRGVYTFFFNIGSVDSFEHAMEEAQEALGVAPNRHVPIVYTSEVSWQQELWRLLPTILLIGGYVWFTRRQMGGLGGGGGGPGGRGIFNVGKASITMLDKNAKNKVTFNDVAGCDEAKVEIMEFVHFLKNPARKRSWGPKSQRVHSSWARPAPARRCWPRRRRARRGCRSSPSPDPTSWRCLWAWGPPVCAISLRRRAPRRPP